MSIGYRSPWSLWRCPMCESDKEGVFSTTRYAMICAHCGEEDGSSDGFYALMRAAEAAKLVEAKEAAYRRIEEARKVKISPKEWAE